MSEPLTLTVRFRPEGAQLAVEYSVANETGEAVYLTNHGVTYGAQGPVPDRNQAWVSFENGVVHVSQRHPRNPGDAFRQPMPHFVTPVKPGTEFRHRIVLPLPLVENLPYKPVKPTGARRLYKEAYFSVGYKHANEWFQPSESERAGHKVWVLRSTLRERPAPVGPVEVPGESFLISERVAIDLPVHETVW